MCVWACASVRTVKYSNYERRLVKNANPKTNTNTMETMSNIYLLLLLFGLLIPKKEEKKTMKTVLKCLYFSKR